MRVEVIPVKDKKHSKGRTYLSPVLDQRMWRMTIAWQYRTEIILFYWGLVLVSVLAGFSIAVMFYDSDVHVRAIAGLTIWYLVRRVIRRIIDSR